MTDLLNDDGKSHNRGVTQDDENDDHTENEDGIQCDRCGRTVPDGNHWVALSVFHWDREGNPNDWSKEDPKNDAYTLCATCWRGIQTEL